MTEYLYSIGDVINGLIITNQCYKVQKGGRKKAYKYRCLKCGYDCGEYYKSGLHYVEHMIVESNLKKRCGLCNL